jgi:hypothetical protein
MISITRGNGYNLKYCDGEGLATITSECRVKSDEEPHHAEPEPRKDNKLIHLGGCFHVSLRITKIRSMAEAELEGRQ